MRFYAFALLATLSLCGQRGPVIETIAGTGGEGRSAASFPLGFQAMAVYLAEDAKGDIYFSRSEINRVFRLGPDGNVTVAAGAGSGKDVHEGIAASLSPLPFPQIIALDLAGNIF